MALSPATKPEPIRFALPRALQRFDFFKRFPYDIRRIIWEEAILTPGIHFLKFVESSSTSAEYTLSTVADRDRSLALLQEGHMDGISTESVEYSAILKPIFALRCANNSHYIAMNNTLSQLQHTCDEAKSLVDGMLAQPDNLALDDGQLVLLQRSSDVVCIDYPDMTHTLYLGTWADHLDLDQLAKIRRLAVRYHHEWDSELVCRHCGRVHSYLGKHPLPRHVYEFAALFKNLEAFYFIDYLTLRKPSSLISGQNNPPGKLESGECGRIYFEVDRDSCTTHTHVYETLSWLRNNYIIHCNCKSQGPSAPESVRFGVLGCEWDSDQELSPPKRLGTRPTKPAKKKRSINCGSSRSLPIVSNARPSQQTTITSTLPVVFGDVGRSQFDYNPKILL